MLTRKDLVNIIQQIIPESIPSHTYYPPLDKNHAIGIYYKTTYIYFTYNINTNSICILPRLTINLANPDLANIIRKTAEEYAQAYTMTSPELIPKTHRTPEITKLLENTPNIPL